MYTKAEVRKAAELLAGDSGLASRLKAYVQSVDLNGPVEKTARFHEDIAGSPVSLGSLLIAAAQGDIIDFANAHLCLKTELLYQQGSPVTEERERAAVDSAYEILDSHGAITAERIERDKRDNINFSNELRAIISALKKEPARQEQQESRVLNFNEERARLKGRAGI